jgi:hypothetical protein
MAGQAAGNSLESVKGAIHSIRERGGVSEMETSAIGGAGRNGSDGNGEHVTPSHKNIADEFQSKMGGNATTGTTGYDSGYGKTF